MQSETGIGLLNQGRTLELNAATEKFSFKPESHKTKETIFHAPARGSVISIFEGTVVLKNILRAVKREVGGLGSGSSGFFVGFPGNSDLWNAL